MSILVERPGARPNPDGMSRWLPWRRRRGPEREPAPGAGRTPSIEELYEERFAYVCHLLRRFGVPERHVEDVAQEVFITVHRRLPTYDATRPLLPWLCGVALHVAKDHQRLARHHREVLMDHDGHDEVDEAPDPEQLTGAEQQRRLVHTFMQTLDIDRRAVLSMHDIDGMPMTDIASALGIEASTGYKRLETARRDMKAAAARHAARERRTTGLAAVLPVPFDLASFLAADRQIPDVAPGIRERVWSRLRDALELGGPGAAGGAGIPAHSAPSSVAQLAAKAGPYLGTFLLGGIVGAATLDAFRHRADDGSKVQATRAQDAPVIVASAAIVTGSAAAPPAPLVPPAPPSATTKSGPGRAAVDTADESELIRQARMAYARGDLKKADEALDMHAKRFPAGNMAADRETLRAQVRERQRAGSAASSSTAAPAPSAQPASPSPHRMFGTDD